MTGRPGGPQLRLDIIVLNDTRFYCKHFINITFLLVIYNLSTDFSPSNTMTYSPQDDSRSYTTPLRKGNGTNIAPLKERNQWTLDSNSHSLRATEAFTTSESREQDADVHLVEHGNEINPSIIETPTENSLRENLYPKNSKHTRYIRRQKGSEDYKLAQPQIRETSFQSKQINDNYFRASENERSILAQRRLGTKHTSDYEKSSDSVISTETGKDGFQQRLLNHQETPTDKVETICNNNTINFNEVNDINFFF